MARTRTWAGNALPSTFKWLLAAAALAIVDRGQFVLDEQVPYGPADLLDHAPTTRAHVSDGFMTVEALAKAAITNSDNSAANILLRKVGVAEHRKEAALILAGTPPSTPRPVVFLAETDSTVVGFIEVGLRSYADGCDGRHPVGFVEGWYVEPEHLGSGLDVVGDGYGIRGPGKGS